RLRLLRRLHSASLQPIRSVSFPHSWDFAEPFSTSIWKVDRHEQRLAAIGNKGPDNGDLGTIGERLLANNRRVWEVIWPNLCHDPASHTCFDLPKLDQSFPQAPLGVQADNGANGQPWRAADLLLPRQVGQDMLDDVRDVVLHPVEDGRRRPRQGSD